MLKALQIKFEIILILLIFTSISKADLLKPNKDILPSEVVKIQLIGLQNNDSDFKDGGIEQTWNFAHTNYYNFSFCFHSAIPTKFLIITKQKCIYA